MIEVGQTIKHSGEQVNARKEIQTAPIENTNIADNNTIQQNNEEWKKRPTLILKDSKISGLIEKEIPEIGKSKSDISKEAKLKMYRYAIPLLEKN